MADSALVPMTAAGTLDGTELVYGYQAGDVKITTAQIKTLSVGTPAAGKVLGGSAPAFTSTPTLGASGTLGTITFGNATSGTITLSPVAGALGTVTLSLPARTDTLVTLAGSETLTNKTLTSPTLTSPALGVATATSLNGLTISTTTGTFTLTNSKTLAVTQTLTLSGTDSTTMTFPTTSATLARTDAAQTFIGAQTLTSPIINGVTHTTATASSIGYIGVPSNSKSAAYTTVLGDAGQSILHALADDNARTFTIDSNANVAYAVGTVLTFINLKNTVTIAITSDTMTLANTATTGSRTLAVNGIATAVKVGTTSWLISGTGLT